MDRKVQEDAQQKRNEDALWIAWDEGEAIRKTAIGRIGTEAADIRKAAKIIDPRVARHLRTWKNVAYLKEPSKPNKGEESLAHGGGMPAVRMLNTDRPPPAVDTSLRDSRAATGPDGLP